MNTAILTTCNTAFEANLIKGMLENNGIDCFLTNENFTSLMPNYNGMMGAGVQVIVDESDIEKAMKLMSSQTNDDEIVCPECGSHNVSFGLGISKIRKIITVLISLFAGTPFGNIKSTWYCQDCKTEFKK